MKRFFTLLGIAFYFCLSASNVIGQTTNATGSEKIRPKMVSDSGPNVEMHSFELAQTANTVKINWQTSREIRHNYFEIQRSFDGVNYEVIALMFAMEDAEKGAAYKYHDHLPYNHPAGNAFYRLKLVDLNGKSLLLSPQKIVTREEALKNK